jgi:hypothetical protein
MSFPPLPHPRVVPLCLLFRNPEFGHEFGTKSADDNGARCRSGVVIATTVGAGFFHSASMMVSAKPTAKSKTTRAANVIGDPSNTNSPNTRGHTGTTALLRTNIDKVGISLFPTSAPAQEAGFLDPASLRRLYAAT